MFTNPIPSLRAILERLANIGEAVETPTQYTLLGWLKGIHDRLGGTLTTSISGSNTPVWAASATGGANAPASVTRAEEAGKRHYIQGYMCAIGGANATSVISVEVRRGSNVLWRDRFAVDAKRGERVGFAWPFPIQAGENEAVSLHATAGGAGVTVDLNLSGYTL